MTTKIHGWVPKNQDRFYGPKEDSTLIPLHESPTLGQGYHSATLVLHGAEPEPVFTLSEVKGLAERVLYQINGDPEQRVRAVFQRMGILLDPVDRYRLEPGTCQFFVSGWRTGSELYHFGPVQYDRQKPVASYSILKAAQQIVDALNRGSISEKTARKRLDLISSKYD